jgi:hypothetical protein
MGQQARAQCLMGNSNAPGTDPTDVEIGQSFMPTCDGTLEYVEIFCSTAGTNVAGVLKIYAGSTVTSTPIHTQAQPATAVNAGEYLRITLSAPVAVTSFSPLTFELPMSLTIPYSGGNPYPGGRMFYDGSNAALYANSDIRFNASVISDCTPTTAFLQASACQSFLSPSGEQWTASGLYTDTIANVQGCDSIITIDLEVIDLDTTLTTDGPQLSANATGVDYQWLDCDNGEQPIAGADQQSFTPTTAGNYAVLISSGGCSEQSACVFVGSTAVGQTAPARPWAQFAQDRSLVLSGVQPGAEVRLLDAQGRTVLHTRSTGPSTTIALATIGPGCYLVVVPGRGAQRVVVQ